jgi:hypothetical protein
VYFIFFLTCSESIERLDTTILPESQRTAQYNSIASVLTATINSPNMLEPAVANQLLTLLPEIFPGELPLTQSQSKAIVTSLTFAMEVLDSLELSSARAVYALLGHVVDSSASKCRSLNDSNGRKTPESPLECSQFVPEVVAIARKCLVKLAVNVREAELEGDGIFSLLRRLEPTVGGSSIPTFIIFLAMKISIAQPNNVIFAAFFFCYSTESSIVLSGESDSIVTLALPPLRNAFQLSTIVTQFTPKIAEPGFPFTRLSPAVLVYLDSIENHIQSPPAIVKFTIRGNQASSNVSHIQCRQYSSAVSEWIPLSTSIDTHHLRPSNSSEPLVVSCILREFHETVMVVKSTRSSGTSMASSLLQQQQQQNELSPHPAVLRYNPSEQMLIETDGETMSSSDSPQDAESPSRLANSLLAQLALVFCAVVLIAVMFSKF